MGLLQRRRAKVRSTAHAETARLSRGRWVEHACRGYCSRSEQEKGSPQAHTWLPPHGERLTGT